MSGGETDFTIPFGYSDVVFNIEGRKVHANRAILAMSSPILENMFEDEGAEEITLDTPDHEGFLELMRVVHPPHKAIEGGNVRRVLPVAHEYDMRHVVSQCERFLETEEPSVSHLLLAETYNLDQLSHKVEQWALDVPLTDLAREPGFKELKRSVLTEILMQKLELGKK